MHSSHTKSACSKCMISDENFHFETNFNEANGWIQAHENDIDITFTFSYEMNACVLHAIYALITLPNRLSSNT